MRALSRAGAVIALTVGCLAAPAGAHGITLRDGNGNLVPVGATADLVSGGVAIDSFLNWSCTGSTLTASVESVGSAEVRARITASSWSGCGVSPVTGHHGPSKWVLRTGDTSDPFESRVDAIDVNFGTTCRYSGKLVDSAVGGSSGGTVEWVNGPPLQLRMLDAGTLTGAPIFPCSAMRIDGTWAFDADWQLT